MSMPRLHRRALLAGIAGFAALLFGRRAEGTEWTATAAGADQFICSLLSAKPVGTGEAAPLPLEAAAPPLAPATTGQWSSTAAWPLKYVHTHLCVPADAPRAGKFLSWSSFLEGVKNVAWDWSTGNSIPLGDADYNIFCSGHTFMADGKLFIAGGHLDGAGGSPRGDRRARIFDPTTGAWTKLPDMNGGRWYPTATTLPNGDILVCSGTKEDGTTWNTVPQVWETANKRWRDLTTSTGQQPWYPHMYVAPNGQVFSAGPGQFTWYLNPAGTGSWSVVGNTNFGDRGWSGHSSVLYADGKVLLAGGGDVDLAPTATAEVINLNDASPRWRYVAPMANPRRQHNMTLLPDGTVLVTGGHSGPGQDNASAPVYPAELWDPATEQWTTLASFSTYRGYHSVAALLPDGRVLSAGGEYGGATAELYAPPYLFKGQRPTITSAPTSVSYGQAFTVGTPDATSITQVTWIRLPSVTHGRDFNQRLNRLTFAQSSGGLTVTAPANRNPTPPGHYMLFLLNGSGVPSVGSIIRIG